jgi:hypothetical protein
MGELTKVNDKDQIINQKTVAKNGYFEILTVEFDSNMLAIKSTYSSKEMDFKTDISYKDVRKDKNGNWIKYIRTSEIPLREETIAIREIVYYE